MRRLLRLLVPAALVAVITVALVTSGGDDGPQPAAASDAADSVVVPKRPTVVFLIFDEWPLDIMLNARGRIDPVRYPNLAALTRTATWFPNAHTTYDSTTKAAPQLLDGMLAREDTTPDFRGHPRTIFDVFGRRGYRIRDSEEATSVCPPRWCPGARPGRPSILPLLQRGRRERLAGFLASIRPGPPTLYVKHMLLPHGPYLFLPDGRQSRLGFEDPVRGMNSVPGFGDRFLTQHNRQRLQLQIGYLDRQLGGLFARMKRQGIFDSSLIAIGSDHGISSDVGVSDRRTVTPANIDEIAPVPLIIKAPGQMRGGVDRSYVRTVDVVPTIADLLNVRMPYRADGRSAFSAAVRRRRFVRMVKRDFSGTITVPASAMERRRAANRRYNLRLYGEGDWARLYTGIGPNRGLLGRTLLQVAVRPVGRVRATIAFASTLRNVNPRSVVLPTQIAGPIRGGARGARRDVAVSVNGTIRAVGRTFYLRGSRQESFALNVPFTSLRPGRNDVRVFEVLGQGAALVPLAGT